MDTSLASKRVLAALLLAVALCAALPTAARAQATRIQQDPQVLGFSSLLCTGVAVAGSASTCTVTVPNGMWAYVTAIEITLVCGATLCTVAAAANVATTNLGGLAFTVPSKGDAAASSVGESHTMFFQYPFPLKAAAPGTNVVVGPSPGVANGIYRINVYGYLYGQ